MTPTPSFPQSYYQWLQWSNDGLMMARTPWSASFTVRPPIWAIAHTTQFVTRGAKLLPPPIAGGCAADNQTSGSGYLPLGGSYVSYWQAKAAHDGHDGSHDLGHGHNLGATHDMTIVIEKISPKTSGCGFSSVPSYTVGHEVATFHLDAPTLAALGGSPLVLSVWRSNFSSVDDNDSYFMRQPDLTVAADGLVSVGVPVDSVITLSTRRGQRKGTAIVSPPPPSNARFPLMFKEDFDALPLHHEAPYFAQMSGAFEVVESEDPQRGRVLMQTGVGYPVIWLRDDVLPYSQVGDAQWTATNTSVDIALPHLVSNAFSSAAGREEVASGGSGGAAFLAARLDGSTTSPPGLLFGIDVDASRWFLAPSLAVLKARNSHQYLAHGALPAVKQAGRKLEWRQLQLNVSARGEASGSIDGTPVFTAMDLSTVAPAHGSVAIGSGQYSPVYFDRFSVSAAQVKPPPPPGPKPLPPPDRPKQGTCDADKLGVGSPINVRGCQTDPKAAAQSWTFYANGTIGLATPPLAHLCLALAKKSSKCSGTCVELALCASAPTWKRGASGGDQDDKLILQAQPRTVEAGNAGSDLCLDVDAVASMTRVETYDCNNNFHLGDNERWDFDQATGIVSSRLFGSETSCMMAC